MSTRSSAESKDFTPIHLPPRPRQKPRLYPRLLLRWFYFLTDRVLFLIGLSVVLGRLQSSFNNLVFEASAVALDPYQALRQNQTLDAIKDRSTVVQPLMADGQSFDVGVIIWARATDEEEADWTHTEEHTTTTTWLSAIHGNFLDDSLGFVPIHSDIPLRQLQLSDISSATMNYSIPGKYFRLKHRISPELKASFHILPTSSSSFSMDNVQFVSSWLHQDAKPPGNLGFGVDTAADDAISYLSFVAPLTKHLQIANPCYNATGVMKGYAGPWTTSQHIVTHTHIQNVRETEIMNYDLFNASHVALKQRNCGKSTSYNESSDYDVFLWSLLNKDDKQLTTCHREYETTGVLETLFEVGVTLEDRSTRVTEWAYAPYFEHSDIDLGPKTINQASLGYEQVIHYACKEKNVGFLGRFIEPRPDDEVLPADSEYMQVQGQDQVDQANSLFSVHRHDSVHPWRRLILSVLNTIFSNIAAAFDILYWYTRSETAFISVPGTLFLALATAIDSNIILRGKDAWSSYLYLTSEQRSWRWNFGDTKEMWLVFWLLHALLTVFLPLQTVWMLMMALKIELGWPSGSEATFFGRNLPSFRRMLPTHRERTSDRLERSTLGWKARMMIVIGLFIAYHAMLPHLPNIIDPLHPPLDPSVLKEQMLYKDLILKESIVDPLFVSGSVFQILLNNASGYFGGSYKIAAVLKGLALTVNIFQFVPYLVGLPESRGVMNVPFLMYAGVVAIQVWQAITLSRVPVVDEKENEE
ncbi:hypothetical protein D9757_013531 [Collybiopsis confluens]|uniref:Uncharacterized protein n=1 Tax=Collybiopsis confluens TaxID=2823264 RepID=A0A8H5D0L4_9AGAR|nr:hypothetical protein D9757_013531 [Collybiopsis confluens]